MSKPSFSPAERLAAVGWAREDLFSFARWMFLQRKGFLWRRAQHHAMICNALMRVFNGECKRLIIMMPPPVFKDRAGRGELHRLGLRQGAGC
ncbi:hypothetical protein [Comamonas sp. wu1-DMT]|uniref:hypothetical protein n=1 Tax=Comamonas sp. wu1-DMT TaxID=3126390 RepID=UPI0032E4E621